MFWKILILFLCLVIPCCKSKDTITTTQLLNINDSLLSKENIFELHFFRPGNSGDWYVGIRYAKLPEKPIVWVANRNDPVTNASQLFLTINGLGNLALYANNVTDIPIWSTNISAQVGVDTRAISARLLDSGNLILVTNDDDANPLWQSFDYPTDTFLPGMKLGFDRRTGRKWSITSWKSDNDPATGDYSFGIDLSGSPQYFLYKGSARIWRSSPWPWTDHPTTISIYPTDFTYLDNKDEIYYMQSPNNRSKLLRLVLEKSGTLRLLMWNLNNGDQWDGFWAAPEYRCDSYAECGANSKCSPDNYSRFQCECLPGFEPKAPTEWEQRNASGGCVRKRKEQQPLTSCGNGDGFVTVARVNRPDTSVGGLTWAASDVECEQSCTRDCSCTAYMNWGTDRGKVGCFLWYGELIDIVEFTSEGYDLKVRVNTKGKFAGSPSSAKSLLEKRQILAVIILSIVSFLFFCFGFLHCWLKRKRMTSQNLQEETRNEPDLPLFHLSAIMAATDSFSLANRLGQGGFGSVYKGLLSDGRKIAVKRLSKSSGQGVAEFKNETMLIAKLQHRNLVKLLGCCIEREEKMLIYEYMPNKSLDSFIFNQTRRSCLDWKTRFEIIIGIARGVLYLHQDSRLRIIHRDLKASNVLLDSEMTPKISDFGMARTFTGDQIHDKTNRVVGTYGYMSPEYAVFGKFSTKSDVFSFGIILLEIISGMRNNHCYLDDSSTNLIAYVWQLWKEDRALEIVDSLLESYSASEALRCIQIGLLCVQEEVKDRPTMSVVVLMLSSEIALPSPEKPAYMFMRNFEDSDSQIEEPQLCSRNQLTITEVVAR